MSLILLSICLIVAAYFLPGVIKFLRKQFHMSSMVRGVPGPKVHPIFGNAHQVPIANTEWTKYFTGVSSEWREKGRNTIPFWFFTQLKIFCLNGESVKDILEHTEEITKSDDYDIVQPWLGTGLLIATGEKWKHRRRMLTPTFHFQMLDGYVKTFDRESKLMTDLLKPYSQSGEQVDLFQFVKRCALDIICDTAMGIQLGSQKKMNHPYAVAVQDMGHIANVYSMRPWMWLKPIFYATGWGFKYDKTLKILTDFTKEVINDRMKMVEKNGLAENGKRKAFLDMLLEMKIKNSLTDEDIREEVDTFMFEGHDTTSSGIAWILWCLATNQDIQQKVADELYGIFGDSDREITVNDIKEMSYLDRVVKESMRINPPVPFIARELQKDNKIGDMMCPAGSMVLISPLIIHRNEQVYPDHMKFNPDRFLPENAASRNAYDYIPFSAGPRNCIGQKFAMYEEKVMVAWIVRKYKIHTDRQFEENIRVPEVILKPDEGIVVSLSARN